MIKTEYLYRWSAYCDTGRSKFVDLLKLPLKKKLTLKTNVANKKKCVERLRFKSDRWIRVDECCWQQKM